MVRCHISLENALIAAHTPATETIPWQRALAKHWHEDPGERTRIENLLIAAQKGGSGSGNWRHTSRTRVGKGRGGSDPGGGIAALGLEAGSTVEQRREAVQAMRRKKPAKTAPARAQSERERQLGTELDEARTFLKTLEAGPVRESVDEYVQTLETQLQQERDMTDALTRIAGVNPAEATASEWRRTADRLQREGYDLYKQYDLEGISFAVDEVRNAQEDAVASLVGGQWVTCRRGAFSRKEATRIKAERWGAAKEVLAHEMGKQLVGAGFKESELKGTSFRQRQQLLRELGSDRLEKTRSGRIAKIGGVPTTVRERVLKTASLLQKANAARTAQDPVDAPTLGAYRKMELADLIRIRYGEPEQGEYAPLNF